MNLGGKLKLTVWGEGSCPWPSALASHPSVVTTSLLSHGLVSPYNKAQGGAGAFFVGNSFILCLSHGKSVNEWAWGPGLC